MFIATFFVFFWNDYHIDCQIIITVRTKPIDVEGTGKLGGVFWYVLSDEKEYILEILFNELTYW